MTTMESATVVNLDLRRERGRRVARAIDMRRGLESPSDRRRRARRAAAPGSTGTSWAGSARRWAISATTDD